METNRTQVNIDSAARKESVVVRWRKACVHTLALLAIAALGFGCASYRGTATSAQPSAVAQQGKWTMVPNFPHVAQAGGNDCGAAALSAVLRFWGHPASP